MIRASCVVALALGLAGCITQSAPISNPAGLPAEALTLEYVVSRACAPYVLGQKSEQEAMRGVQLTRIKPLFGLMPGDTVPFWQGAYPGRPRVNVGGQVCNTIVRGASDDAFRTAAEAAVRRGLGAGSIQEDGRAEYETLVPGQITGCREGVRYTFYRGWGGFDVDLTGGVSCAHDLMKRKR